MLPQLHQIIFLKVNKSFQRYHMLVKSLKIFMGFIFIKIFIQIQRMTLGVLNNFLTMIFEGIAKNEWKKERKKERKKENPSFVLEVSSVRVHPMSYSRFQGSIVNDNDRGDKFQSFALTHWGATHKCKFNHFHGCCFRSFWWRSGWYLDMLQESHCTSQDLGNEVFFFLFESNPLIV